MFDEIGSHQIIEHLSRTNYGEPHRAAIRAAHRDMFHVFMSGASQNRDIAILRYQCSQYLDYRDRHLAVRPLRRAARPPNLAGAFSRVQHASALTGRADVAAAILRTMDVHRAL